MPARLLTTIVAVFFTLSLMLVLVLTNVRLLVFDPGYYRRGYERHGVALTTGMTPAELEQSTAQVQNYFRGGPPVTLVVQKEWGPEPLFNPREQQHLAEVRELLNLAFRSQEVLLAFLFVAAAALLLLRRAAGARLLARWLSLGAGLTLTIFAALGLLALADFDFFWTQFHLLSFSSSLWMLDPRTDYLIRLYPVPFWFEAVQDVIGRSIGGAVAILVLAQGGLYLERRLARRSAHPIGQAQVARP